MLKHILFVLILMSFFTSFSYADYYVYIDNPDPENFEISAITHDDKYNFYTIQPSKPTYKTDDGIEHACWHFEDKPITTNISILYKTRYSAFCSLFFHSIIGYAPRVYGLCSFHSSEATFWSGPNTFWMSPSQKADGTPATELDTNRHDCDGTQAYPAY